ncbi:DUF4854 domain-containing protein [Bifidobacterium longum]|uniref:DUF4854 domain-containing protein n=1 Tax=Bifidobacterium longum TaxID=216816 RepID=UPI001F3B1D22|nr:DUF4854 domain-containing protein [Bifidobacterium longum]UIP49492.1 DUF4854 domain-containing protein [Bifidobacterium longum]
MTDPNANPNGQVPGQQADANPTEPLNAMTGEAGTAANNAPTQALAAGEQPTQAFTPVEQPTQAFTPAEQSTQPLAPVNQPVPPTQALPPVTPAAAPAPAPTAPAPAPAPAAPNSPYPGTAPAASVLRYPGGGAVPPQTPYNPYMQGGQPNGQPGWSGSYGSVPPEANQKYNGLAIAGFICSFLVSLPGLILSIVGLNQIKKQGGKGKGLAIAGIIISAAGMVIQVILVIALIVGGVSYTSKAIDEAKTDSFYSQSSSGNGDSSDKSKAQDNLDDALDDTLGETYDDLTDGDYGLYDSIQDFVDSSEFKDSIESEADTFADTGITFNYRVDGDTLVYEYVLDDSYASLGDTVASSLDAMDSTYQSTANLLGSMCKTSSGKASLRVIMHTQSGQSLYDKTWTEK